MLRPPEIIHSVCIMLPIDYYNVLFLQRRYKSYGIFITLIYNQCSCVKSKSVTLLMSLYTSVSKISSACIRRETVCVECFCLNHFDPFVRDFSEPGAVDPAERADRRHRRCLEENIKAVHEAITDPSASFLRLEPT